MRRFGSQLIPSLRWSLHETGAALAPDADLQSRQAAFARTNTAHLFERFARLQVHTVTDERFKLLEPDLHAPEAFDLMFHDAVPALPDQADVFKDIGQRVYKLECHLAFIQ